MHPKVGDLVQLKSGGPIMTVFEDNGYGILQVTFFHQDGEIRRLSFIPAVLNNVTAFHEPSDMLQKWTQPGVRTGGVIIGSAPNNGLGGGQGG